MSVVFALFTSHPPLMACELERAAGRVLLSSGQEHTDAGAGWFAQDALLLRRYSHDAAPPRVTDLLATDSAQGTEGLLYHSGPVPPGMNVDENAQPVRARGWLFAQAGPTHTLARVESRLLSAEPGLDLRQLRGQTDAEVTLTLLHKLLRDQRVADERAVEAKVAARALGRAGRTLESCLGEPDGRGPSWVALTRDLLIAARGSGVPLHYALLEGNEHCPRCHLDGRPRQEALGRMHRARRTVLVSSHPRAEGGFIELPPGHALAVNARLDVAVLSV